MVARLRLVTWVAVEMVELLHTLFPNETSSGTPKMHPNTSAVVAQVGWFVPSSSSSSFFF